MKTLSRVLILAVGVSAFGLAGCATTDSAACSDDGSCQAPGASLSQNTNTTCPFSGEPVDASIDTVSFQGKEVGFCCAKCAAKFEAMSDADKMAALGN